MRNLSLAYLDAGSGSLIIQMLVGGFAGVVALFRYRWHNLRQQGAESATDVETESENPPV